MNCHASKLSVIFQNDKIRFPYSMLRDPQIADLNILIQHITLTMSADVRLPWMVGFYGVWCMK